MRQLRSTPAKLLRFLGYIYACKPTCPYMSTQMHVHRVCTCLEATEQFQVLFFRVLSTFFEAVTDTDLTK